MAKIIIPRSLTKFTDHNDELTLSFETLFQLATHIKTLYPALHKILFTEKNEIQKYACLYLNGQIISEKQYQIQKINENDTLELLIAIAGG